MIVSHGTDNKRKETETETEMERERERKVERSTRTHTKGKKRNLKLLSIGFLHTAPYSSLYLFII